jgi:hypothetical protein
MFASRQKMTVALLLGLAALGGLGLFAAGQGPRPAPPPDRPAVKPVAGAKLPDLLKKRYEMAKNEFNARALEHLTGRGSQDLLLGAAARLLQAELDLAGNKAARLAAYQAQLERLKEVRDVVKARHEAGRLSAADYYQGEGAWLKAAIDLEREKAR